ncbi:MAG: flagellar hook assembly protein FlgD [Bryobacteraceae bacterium]
MNPLFFTDSAGMAAAAAGNAGTSQAAGPRPANSMNPLANKEVFLQLLVAQIRHQNPLKPAEGTEFVAQLAQFTQLELTLGIRKDLEQIRQALSARTEADPPAGDGSNPR